MRDDVGAYKANLQSTDLYRYVRVTAKNIRDCYKLLQLKSIKVVDKDKVAVILEPSTTQPRGKHHAIHSVT